MVRLLLVLMFMLAAACGENEVEQTTCFVDNSLGQTFINCDNGQSFTVFGNSCKAVSGAENE